MMFSKNIKSVEKMLLKLITSLKGLFEKICLKGILKLFGFVLENRLEQLAKRPNLFNYFMFRQLFLL